MNDTPPTLSVGGFTTKGSTKTSVDSVVVDFKLKLNLGLGVPLRKTVYERSTRITQDSKARKGYPHVRSCLRPFLLLPTTKNPYDSHGWKDLTRGSKNNGSI